MIFFELDDRPELPSLLLPPSTSGADVEDAAGMTVLEVDTVLKVLLPLTEIIVVTIWEVMLPVDFD